MQPEDVMESMVEPYVQTCDYPALDTILKANSFSWAGKPISTADAQTQKGRIGAWNRAGKMGATKLER